MSPTVYVCDSNEVPERTGGSPKESSETVQPKSLTMERLKEIIRAWPHDDAPLL